jgi:hypothetical protein
MSSVPTVPGQLKKFQYDVNVWLVSGYVNPSSGSPPGILLVLDNFLNDLTFFEFYDDCVMPVVQFTFLLPADIFKQIQGWANTNVDLKFLMNIHWHEAGNQGPFSGSRAQSMSDRVLIPIDLPNVPMPDTDPDSGKAPHFRFVVPCFYERHMKINKQLLPFNLKGATVGDAVLYLFMQAGAEPGSLLMDEPENLNVYDSILVPPVNLVNGIRYLQEVYGLYTYGVKVFFDYDRYYLLRRDQLSPPPQVSGDTTPWRIMLDLVQQATTSIFPTGSVLDTARGHYYLRSFDETEFVSEGDSVMEVGGEDGYFRYVTTGMYHGEENISLAQSVINIDAQNSTLNLTYGLGPKQICLWDRYCNPFTHSTYRNELARGQLSFRLPWSDLDLNIFSLNKRWTVRFLNDGYAGVLDGPYAPRQNLFKLSKGRSDKYYSLHGSTLFEKINNDYYIDPG